MKVKITDEWKILNSAFKGWSDDNATTLAGALAYYTIFSIAPLILITVAVAGLFFGKEASQGEIYRSMSGLLGSEGAKGVQSFVEGSAVKSTGIIATIIGIVTLLLGATSAFAQLQDSLNIIWKVKQSPKAGIWGMVRQRLLSFSLILVLAFLLLVSLILGAALAAIGHFTSELLPGGEAVWQVVNLLVSFGVTSLLFGAIYKILPDVKLTWRDVWRGGLITAFFFTIGKSLIGLYIGKSGVGSTYGAAGSAIVILVWAYYSAAILLFGAEFTKFNTLKNGRKLDVKAGSEWILSKDDPSLVLAVKKDNVELTKDVART
ncbi:MAG: YihY/virulence factor BrkB family protein [Bdellovibrionales bacterium]|nr:YihY/virulence factor BrkB family protein [Oligoflexia bacterium]